VHRKTSNWRKETSILAEMRSGPDNGKYSTAKEEDLKKYKVTNAREIAQLTDNEAESASQSQKNQSIKKGKHSISRIRCSRMTTTKFHRNLGTKNMQARESRSVEDLQPHWKSLWGEKAQHDERAEWIIEQRRKVSNMNWVTKEL